MDRSAGTGMGQANGHQSVNYVDNRKQGHDNKRSKSFKKDDKSDVVCGKCTLRGHTAEKCRVKCRNCKRVGHLAANCRSGKPIINILMNGRYVRMEVDTGAAVSCISSDVFNRLGLAGHVLSECDVTLCVA